MTVIAVQIEQTSTGLTAVFPRKMIGSIRDDNAYEFRFTRPRGYEGHDLTIIITDSIYGQLPAANLGKGDIWTLANTHTLSEKIQFRAEFSLEGSYVESTAVVALQLREINRRPSCPIPPENPLWIRSFASAEESGGYLVFRNIDGKEVARVLSSGGEGGHVILGENGNEMPQRRALFFPDAEVDDTDTATVIRGLRGRDGKDGEPGKDGADGTPGTDGRDGVDGADGKDGKSAFASAVDGGYTGTEAQFNFDLATVSQKSRMLIFTGKAITTSTWAADTTYADYGYRAAIALDGVTADMVPTVIFSPVESATGDYAPIANSYDGGVHVYAKAKPTKTITIPTITAATGGN